MRSVRGSSQRYMCTLQLRHPRTKTSNKAILIQRRWKTAFTNCRTFQSADISSDHSLMLCNIKLRLKKLHDRPLQGFKVDVNRLRDEKTRQSYSATLARNTGSIEPTGNMEKDAKEMSVSSGQAQLHQDICGRVKKSVGKNKENWIQHQCEEADKGSTDWQHQTGMQSCKGTKECAQAVTERNTKCRGQNSKQRW